MAENLKKSEWVEIAAAGFIIALIAWILHHYVNSQSSQPVSTNPSIVLPASSSATPEATTPLLPYSPVRIGLPQIPLPGSTCDCGGCNGCAVGTTATPTLQQITDNTNAAIDQINQMYQTTLDTLASIGNQEGNGLIQYRVSGG